MEPTLIGILSIVALLVLLALGVHIAVALGGCAIGGLLLTSGWKVTASLTANSLYVGVSDYSLVLIPLFVIMGSVGAAAGIVEDSMKFAFKWFGGLRGSLALTTIFSCALFAAACGSSTATAAAIGKFMIPEMERYGYDKKLATGTVAAAGTFGILIPPSIVLVVFGVITDTPIGPLFIAGILPGGLSAIVYMIGVFLLVHFRPELAPPAKKFSWNERIMSIKGLWGILVLIGIIWGGIYGGIFTPTEAGGAGAFAAFVILLSKARLRGTWIELKAAVPDAVKTTAMIFVTMVMATLFSKFLTLAGFLDGVLVFMSSRTWPVLITVLLIFSVTSVMGCFMTAMGVLLIIAPTATTVLTSLGFDALWVGIMMVKLFELANITPPVGMNVYVVKGVAPHVPIEDIFRGIGLFALMDAISIGILIVFPQIVLWLPHTMG